MSSIGRRYKPEGNPLSSETLCQGFERSSLCSACGRRRPGRVTMKHSNIPLGLSPQCCSYRKG